MIEVLRDWWGSCSCRTTFSATSSAEGVVTRKSSVKDHLTTPTGRRAGCRKGAVHCAHILQYAALRVREILDLHVTWRDMLCSNGLVLSIFVRVTSPNYSKLPAGPKGNW